MAPDSGQAGSIEDSFSQLEDVPSRAAVAQMDSRPRPSADVQYDQELYTPANMGAAEACAMPSVPCMYPVLTLWRDRRLRFFHGATNGTEPLVRLRSCAATKMLITSPLSEMSWTIKRKGRSMNRCAA